MSKDYLNQYNAGKRPVLKYQAGGDIPADASSPAGPYPGDAGAGGPAPGGNADAGGPDIDGMLMEAYQTQDPQKALQFVNILAEMTGVAGNAPGASTSTSPPAQAPVPMGRRGMQVPVFSKHLLK